MTDRSMPTRDERLAYVADMLIELAIILRGGRPATEADEAAADTETV